MNSSLSTRAEAFKQHLKEKDTNDRNNELERYLDDACSNDTEKFDILTWWKQNGARYPIVASMVRDILAIPVSTVALESVFSTGGRVLDSYRSLLSPAMVEALICSQNWLKPTVEFFKDLNLNEEYEITEGIVTGSMSGRARPNSGESYVGVGTSSGVGTSDGVVSSAQSQPSGCDWID